MPDPVQNQNGGNSGGNETPPVTPPNDAETNLAALRAKLEKQQQQTLSLAAKMAGYDPENKTTQLIMREFAKQDDVEFTDESFLKFARDEYGFEPVNSNSNPGNDGNNGNGNAPPSDTGNQMPPTAIDQLHNSGTTPSEPTDLDRSLEQLKAGDIRGSIETKVNAILGDPARGIRPKITQDNPYIL